MRHDFRPAMNRLVAQLRKKDPKAFDLSAVKDVERAMRREYPGASVARPMPVAEDTWEISTTLLSAQPSASPVVVEFPGPVEIHGAYAVVRGLSTPAPLPAPTADDIRVSLQINDRNFRTVARYGVSGAANTNSNVSTLSALVQPNRVLAFSIENDNPRIALGFQWARGANLYQDAAIFLAFYVSPIGKWAEG